MRISDWSSDVCSSDLTAAQGRTLEEESTPESGFYFRSDHFNFAKAGVPALYTESGEDLVEGGREAGEAAARDYNANRYHKPGDAYSDSWKQIGRASCRERVWQYV